MVDRQHPTPSNAAPGREQESRQFPASLSDGEWALLSWSWPLPTPSRDAREEPMCGEAVSPSQPLSPTASDVDL
jgi:hypothetical protein